MNLLQLKMPPDRVELVADAIDFYIEDGKNPGRDQELTEISAWLRHRLARWHATHPATPAA